MSVGVLGAKMITNIFKIFLLFVVVLFNQLLYNEQLIAQDSRWSKGATFLRYEKHVRKMEIYSPDRKKRAIIDSTQLIVLNDEKRLSGIEEAGVNTLAELLWSPNSDAFFITESDGGEVGTWQVSVYKIEGNHVNEIDVSNKVLNSFKKQYKCTEIEDPNIGAIKWLNGGKNILLVAEVPPHSSCNEMGKVRGYVVEISSGRITKEFDEKALKLHWGIYLGKRIMKN